MIRFRPKQQRLSGLAPARPLARLHWQLTLSFMVVTVLATLLVETVLLSILGYRILYAPDVPREMVTDIQRESHKGLPLLRKHPVDKSSVTLFLEKAIQEQQPKQGIDLELSVNDTYSLICVTDPDGKILAHLPHNKLSLTRPLMEQLDTTERSLLARALKGENDPAHLAFRTTAGYIIVAVPIQEEDRTIRGAVFYRTATSFTPLSLIKNYFRVVAPTIALVTIGSGIAGIVFGAITSRRLTTRLSGIAHAADAWAQGDLAATAPEQGEDELSLLSQRLNRMARELGDMFLLRQELATVDERHRLARELHDTVKQQVFATAMQLAAVRALVEQQETTRALARLSEAETLAHQTQKELMTILQELRPVRGSKRLSETLREYLSDWERRTGINSEFLAGEVPGLPDEMETAFLRITQEAFANIERHSQATTARVFLHKDNTTGNISLSISDNGRGFRVAVSEHQNGMGLSTMRERADRLPEGRFTLHSVPGSGTRIEVKCSSGTGATQ